MMKSKKHTRAAIIISVALILCAGGAAIALGAGRAASTEGDEPRAFAMPDDWLGNLDGVTMTLDDVRALSAKGDDLLFEDFQHYQGGNASSTIGHYLMVYAVEGGYRMIVIVDSSLSEKPDSVMLQSIWDGGRGIDIRYYDVDAFLNANPSHPALTAEET